MAAYPSVVYKCKFYFRILESSGEQIETGFNLQLEDYFMEVNPVTYFSVPQLPSEMREKVALTE